MKERITVIVPISLAMAAPETETSSVGVIDVTQMVNGVKIISLVGGLACDDTSLWDGRERVICQVYPSLSAGRIGEVVGSSTQQGRIVVTENQQTFEDLRVYGSGGLTIAVSVVLGGASVHDTPYTYYLTAVLEPL